MSSPRGTRQPSPGQEALFSLSEIPWPLPRPVVAPGPADVPDLAGYDILLANLSGGKDSQTMLRALVRAAEAAGARDRVVCVFADLGEQDEWPGTAETAARHAAWYGLRFITVCRTITDPATGARRQQGLLEHIERRGMWPDARNRYCTSDLKRGPIRTVITQLVAEQRQAGVTGRAVRVLNVLGMRAQESPKRRLMAPFRHDERASNGVRLVDEWLPVHSWTADQVWADIHASGVPYHYAYDLGMPRLSCMFCVLASESALVLAAQHNPAGAARRLAAEHRMAARKIVLTLAVALLVRHGTWPGPVVMTQLRRAWRAGHLFQRGRSMAQIIAKAQAAGPARVPAADWAA